MTKWSVIGTRFEGHPMKKTSNESGYIVGGVFVFLVVLLCIWVTKSHFEAVTYERLTGKHVSTWDAMWVELRVQESAR